MFSRESMAMLIGNIGIQACHHKGFPMNDHFPLKPRKFFLKSVMFQLMFLHFTLYVVVKADLAIHNQSTKVLWGCICQPFFLTDLLCTVAAANLPVFLLPKIILVNNPLNFFCSALVIVM